MSNPKFSVITPAYNASAYIESTIQSVLQQSFADFEHIIVDDHSTDATLTLAQSYANKDSRFRVLQTDQRSGGPARPRNIGIASAQGTFVALLDADDLWGPDKLRHDALFLAQNPELDGVYSGCDYFLGDPANVRFRVRPKKMNRRILITNPIPTLTFAFKRSLFSEEGFRFDEEPALRAIEDYHLALEMYLKGKKFNVRPGCDAYYRMMSNGSIYSANDKELNIRRHLYNFSKMAWKAQLPANTVLTAGMALLALLAVRRVTGRI